ncbi:MAG: metallophosphoesterase [Candidatus Aenigmatarchaeota archaeon]
MKIGFISDLHLGFGRESEIFNDIFQISEKIILELSESCDIVFIVGDLFDEKNPNNEIILKLIQIFKKVRKRDKKIRFKINEESFEESAPIFFAIHGNHDRKFKDETSIYKIFEEIGIFHYISLGKILIESDQKICIYAMSNVPERYAKNVLFEKLAPKIEKDYFNILVLHQNIYPYVYSIEDSSLKISDLPKNFNLIVNGHIHIRNVEKTGNTTLLILGSPVITKLHEREINERRGYNIVEIYDKENFNIIFQEIELPRKYYLIEIDSEKINLEDLEKNISEKINKNKEKPVIKIKLLGKAEIDEKVIKNILQKYEDKAILRIENLIESERTSEIIKNIEIIKERKSIDEIIISTILERLKQKKFSNSFDFQKLIELFEDGDVDTLIDIITKTQKTLI